MRAKTEILFKTEDVWKIYRKGGVPTNALRGVDLKIKKGEYVAILGPSGSGKSTLMHILGCLDKPSKGSVLIDGKKVSEMTSAELVYIRRNKIGFVFQAYNLIGGFTAIENVSLPLRLKGVSKPIANKKATELLKKVGLWDRMKHKPNELSGGEQQRVAIARALINDPEVILADEPTGNLDTKTGIEIIKLLEGLNKDLKKTIIIVTHDPGLASKTRREIFIKDGKIAKRKQGDKL